MTSCQFVLNCLHPDWAIKIDIDAIRSAEIPDICMESTGFIDRDHYESRRVQMLKSLNAHSPCRRLVADFGKVCGRGDTKMFVLPLNFSLA